MDIEKAREALQGFNVIWQSVLYDPRNVVSVYARRQGAIEVRFEEVNLKGKTIRTSWHRIGREGMPQEWSDKKAAEDGVLTHLMAGLSYAEREECWRRAKRLGPRTEASIRGKGGPSS